MKILHVLHLLDQRSGGPLRTVLELSDSWSTQGMECEAVGVGKTDIPDNPLQDSAIYSCRISFPQSYLYSPHLRMWLRENVQRFDGVVIHGMWLYPNLVGAQECLRARVPYVCLPHGMLEPWAVRGQGWLKYVKKYLYWHLNEKRIFGNSECVVFTTKREYELGKTIFPFPLLSTVLPPFGVHGLAAPVPRPLSIPIQKATGSKYALFLGRLHYKKNLDFLLRAWAQAGVQRNFRLVVAGPAQDNYLSELKELSKHLKISDQVFFLDFVSGNDKLYLLQNAQWLLLPSKQESFGITVLEALQNGCPVVISDKVFLADELKNHAVILKLNLEDWVCFLSGEMMNEELRRNYIESGRSFLLENYEIRRIAKLWNAFLMSLFSLRRHAGKAVTS